MAGFTTVRDLGTEGAGYADVELKQAVDRASFPARACSRRRAPSSPPAATRRKASRRNGACRRAPRKPTASTALRASCATRSAKAPTGSSFTRDYRWGPMPGRAPTFSLDEMKLAVETAKSAGVPVAVHANTAEGHAARDARRRRDDRARRRWHTRSLQVDGEHHVALCPTLAAGEPMPQYRRPEPGRPSRRAMRKRASFKAALDAGVTILQRQRRRHVPARRQRARDRTDGRLRDVAVDALEERDVGCRACPAHGEQIG